MSRSSRSRRGCHFERNEDRLCLSTVAFESHPIDVTETTGGVVLTADLDNDGDQDVLSGDDQGISWFENVDGQGGVANPDFITRAGELQITADVDGDGDVDILAQSDNLDWYENTGNARFILRSTSVAIPESASLLEGDVDSDGDVDLVYYGAEEFGVISNADGLGTFELGQVVITSPSHSHALVDVDHDGDLDLVTGDERKVSWYENDGAGRFESEQDLIRRGSMAFVLTDLDEDQRLDLILVDYQQMRWYEAKDDPQLFSLKQAAAGILDFEFTQEVIASDIDGDSQKDILVHSAVGAEFVSGIFPVKLNSNDQLVITDQFWTPAAESLFPSDLDNDGVVDLLISEATDHRILRLKYDGRLQQLDHVADRSEPVYSFQTTDIDSDGDFDIVTATTADACPVVFFGPAECYSTVAWQENLDGAGHFGPRQVIKQHDGADYQRWLSTGDIDQDGDNDVLTRFDDELVWFENVDGLGNFATSHVIVEQAKSVPISLGDIDGDGDPDALAADGKVVWYENLGGGQFGPATDVSDLTSSWSQVSAEDVNGDGHLDVLAAGSDNLLILLQSDAVQGEFAVHETLPTVADGGYDVGDVDGDGDVDLVVTTDAADAQVAWYENVDGTGNFKPTFSPVGNSSHRGILAADLDTDGDVDAVRWREQRLIWHPNRNGQGVFSPYEPIPSELSGPIGSDDINGDGRLDLIVASRSGIMWLENRTIGDVNGDSIFNSSDLVEVLVSAEYDDGVPGNSTFDEGDWNGDLEFDSGDLLIAFQAGHYIAASVPVASEVAAAVDFLFSEEDAKKSRRGFVA